MYLFFNTDLEWFWKAQTNDAVLPIWAETLLCVILESVDQQILSLNLEDLLETHFNSDHRLNIVAEFGRKQAMFLSQCICSICMIYCISFHSFDMSYACNTELF